MLKNVFNLPAVLPAVIFFVLIYEICGHGMMLDPVSRSSRWRYNKSAPINYDDNGLFCGGLDVQWIRNKGKCGLCGDSFDSSRPRDNEIGGKYGQGVITKVYSPSQTAKLGVKITTNHLGYFYFNICNLDKFKEESDECFSANKIHFADGSLKMYIGKKSGMIYPTIVLPKGLNCKHCVLRWNYQAGNNWGPCGNGTSALGCGPQENFKGCSDISITTESSKIKFKVPEKKFYKKIFNQGNNLYDFVPKEKPHSSKALKDESSWKNYIDNVIFELKKEKQKAQVLAKELVANIENVFKEHDEEKDIGNILRESEEKEEAAPNFIDDDQLYKEGNGIDDNLFDLNKIQERVPKMEEADQFDTGMKSDFYDFDNGIDDNLLDFENV